MHAFSDDAVMAGNGTIGLEIVEDLPDVDAVVAPYGGGGLRCGIASALSAARPVLQVFARRGGDGRSLAPSLEAGHPVKVEYTPSFVDGIGSPGSSPRCSSWRASSWPARSSPTLEEVEDAIRLLAGRARVVAEGAGATALAVALSGARGYRQDRVRRLGREHRPATLAAILGG